MQTLCWIWDVGLALTRSICYRYPHLKIVSLDRNDQTIKIAREEIVRKNLQGRIHLRKGDFFVDDIGNDYDLVFLSSIICIFGEKENINLLRKVKESLKTWGTSSYCGFNT